MNNLWGFCNLDKAMSLLQQKSYSDICSPRTPDFHPQHFWFLDSDGKLLRVSHTMFFITARLHHWLDRLVLVSRRFYQGGTCLVNYNSSEIRSLSLQAYSQSISLHSFPCFSHLVSTQFYYSGFHFPCAWYIAPFQPFSHFTQQRHYTSNQLTGLHDTTISWFPCFSDPLPPPTPHNPHYLVQVSPISCLNWGENAPLHPTTALRLNG